MAPGDLAQAMLPWSASSSHIPAGRAWEALQGLVRE
jgi:hypothetical protein